MQEHLTPPTDQSISPDEIDGHEWVTIYCEKCGHDHKIRKTCSFRFCPFCSKTRALKIRKRLRFILDQHPPVTPQTLKMITLSTKNCLDLRAGIKHLVASFRRLRQTKNWKFHVSGGATIIEITGKKGNWHPHLHILCYSRYYLFKDLLSQWKTCSGGSAVWISAIPKGKAEGYVTKYITKTEILPEDQAFVSDEIKRVRLFQRFGLWHSFVIPKTKCDLPCPVCGEIMWISMWQIDKMFRGS